MTPADNTPFPGRLDREDSLTPQHRVLWERGVLVGASPVLGELLANSLEQVLLRALTAELREERSSALHGEPAHDCPAIGVVDQHLDRLDQPALQGAEVVEVVEVIEVVERPIASPRGLPGSILL